jgi:hypothetical protein
MQDLKPLNFFLVLCKTRKKFDKYIKLNKIRNKYIIDIKKMMDEEEVTAAELATSDLFKILILKKFNLAKDKKKDIYYIPNFSITKQYGKLFNIKDILSTTHNFNLLYFYEDFEKGQQPTEILEKIADFDITQILKDY